MGKSTLCRMIAREAVINGLIAKIADFDVRQSTTKRWTERRMQNGIQPTIRAETFLSVSEALKDAADFDVFLLDGAPQASKQTKEMAVAADLLIIPTGDSFEDREPAVELANDLYSDGVNPAKIAFALCRVGDSKAQLAEARAYLGKTQYTVLDGEMPEARQLQDPDQRRESSDRVTLQIPAQTIGDGGPECNQHSCER